MFKRKDLILILAVLALAGILYLGSTLLYSGKTAGNRIRVYVDGQLYTEQKLAAGESITIRQEDGSENVIRMTDTGFYMESSTCHNQLCVQQGEVNAENFNRRSLGTHVICLPNRVDVELVLDNGVTADPDAPDV